MPTRTQQSDVLACAYASHGDTKHVLLFPCDPKECFEMTAESFDLADRLQTSVIVMSDLDLGMNDHVCMPMECDDIRRYDRGKVLDRDALDSMDRDWGRQTMTASVIEPTREPTRKKVPVLQGDHPMTNMPHIQRTVAHIKDAWSG